MTKIKLVPPSAEELKARGLTPEGTVAKKETATPKKKASSKSPKE